MGVLARLAACGAVAALMASSAGVAGALDPPVVPPGPAPGDPVLGPDQPMHQIAGCVQTGVLPGSDFREMPPALKTH